MKSVLPACAATFALIVVAATAVTPAAAIPTNPCTKGWTTNQSTISCDIRDVGDWIIEQLPSIVLPAIVGILVLVLTALTCIGRYACGCCGSALMRPDAICCGGAEWDGQSEDDIKIRYDARLVLATKVMTFVLLVLAVVAVALSFVGAGGVLSLFTVISDGVAKFARWTTNALDDLLTGLNPNNSVFTSARNAINETRSMVDRFRGNGVDQVDRFKFVSSFVMGLAGPSAVIAACAIAAVVFAVMNVQWYGPMLLVLLLMFVAVPTGILGTAASLLNLPFKVACAEFDAQLARQPGMFQYYVVPTWCEGSLGLSNARSNVDSAVASLVNQTCNDVAARCDSSPVYNIVDGRYLRCDTTPRCTTTQQLLDLVTSITIKAGYPGETCMNCTIRQCSESCTDSSLRAAASSFNTNASDANTAYVTLTRVIDRYISCNLIADQLVRDFDVCSTVSKGLSDLHAGSAIGLTVCCLLIITLFMGQKRWFTPSAFNAEQAEYSVLNFGGRGAAAAPGNQDKELALL